MNMNRKIVFAVLLLSTVPLAAYAADAEKAAPPQGDNASSPPAVSSYFQGTWAGSWPGGGTASQDVTLVIGRSIGEKTFEVTYSWGAVSGGRRNVLPGEVKTEGREQDDKFIFRYESDLKKKIEVVLQKEKDDEVKARVDKSGVLAPGERSFNETRFKRR